MRTSTVFVVSCLVLANGPAARAATIFGFQFDLTADGVFSPPAVGTGVLSFANDPGDGTHPLTSVGAFSMSFTFGEDRFNQHDIATPLSEVLIVLSGPGPSRRLQFSNISLFGSGPFQGSLDLVNGAGDSLSFEPPGLGRGLTLYSESSQPSQTPSGDYLATQVVIPEPASVVLLATGFLGFMLSSARQRRVNRRTYTWY
jgi:hypothetical protein